jgi:hypothetical protein
MAYTKLSIAQITKIDSDYKLVKDQLQAVDLPRQQKTALEKKQQTYLLQAQQRLKNIIGVTEGYFETHKNNTEQWLTEAENLFKNAQVAAAKYRKDPTTQDNATFVENFVADIAARKNRYGVDSHDYGEAWEAVRAYNAANLPKEATEEFTTDRAKLIGDQRAVIAAGNKLAELSKQAEALKDIIAKASMKKDMKGGAEQRNIGVARTAAKAVADDLAEQLRLLLHPVSMNTPAPAKIQTGAQQLQGANGLPNYPQTKKDWVTALGFWQDVELAQKNLVTRAASMEKVLATRTRGFRSNELSDKTVKAELAKAAKSVKDVKAEVKKYASHYAAAKKQFALLQAKAKKARLV